MAMNFENHERNWRKGKDIDERNELLLRKDARNKRIAMHAAGQRSFYFAPGGKLDANEIHTDDYHWNTRTDILEKQGRNIMTFPKTFEEVHDGRPAGLPPVVRRPFSGSDVSEEPPEILQLNPWGTVDLFADSNGVRFDDEQHEEVGIGSIGRTDSRGRGVLRSGTGERDRIDSISRMGGFNTNTGVPKLAWPHSAVQKCAPRGLRARNCTRASLSTACAASSDSSPETDISGLCSWF